MNDVWHHANPFDRSPVIRLGQQANCPVIPVIPVKDCERPSTMRAVSIAVRIALRLTYYYTTSPAAARLHLDVEEGNVAFGPPRPLMVGLPVPQHGSE